MGRSRFVPLLPLVALSFTSLAPSQATDGLRLSPTVFAPNRQFGVSVALSEDTALVGANGYGSPGSAFVFLREADSWTQQAELTANSGTSDEFGISVALSGDTALIGDETGSAYVFVRNGTNWIQQVMWTGRGQYFGVSVALDGDTAIVGAPSFTSSGFAYIFVRNGTTWTQDAKLSAGGDRDLFGYPVALDGDTALVGASRSDLGYVFVRNEVTQQDWTQQAVLTGNDTADGDRFGSSLALTGDTALVGAPEDDDAGSQSGSAYLFMRSGTTWKQETKLTASNAAAGDLFGESVALTGDTVLVGTQSARSVYVFTPGDQGWGEQARISRFAGAFGSELALSGDMALIGAWGGSAGSSGSAYVYELALARAAGFGAGCLGTVSVPDLQAGPSSLPKTGRTFELVFAGFPANSPACLILGLSNTRWLSMDLPMSLAPYGAPECRLLVSGDYHAPVVNTNGTSTQGIPIPADPSLAGLHLYVQGAVLDPGANQLGVVVSNGLDLTVGIR